MYNVPKVKEDQLEVQLIYVPGLFYYECNLPELLPKPKEYGRQWLAGGDTLLARCRLEAFTRVSRFPRPSLGFGLLPQLLPSTHFASRSKLVQAFRMQLLGVRFAPLFIPLERRLQTSAAAAWFVTMAFGPFICFFATIYMVLFTRFCYLALLYVAWLVYDRKAAHRGGRRFEHMRNWTWWYYFKNYFPLSLHKTTDLPPNKNYLFCVYPHGMLCSGAFGNFATNYSDFSGLFPGITPYILTLNAAFNMPLTRDFVLGLGACAASKEGMLHLLNDSSHPKAVVLMVGGASEAFKCRPGTYTIILKRRKGFVKVALETGSPLVPVFSFGETNLYDQVTNPPGSWRFALQETFRKISGMAPVIPIGRGLFQYNFGVVPRRLPVATVVGAPIEVPKMSCPSDEVINELHTKFTCALVKLFEEHKHRFEKVPGNSELIIE